MKTILAKIFLLTIVALPFFAAESVNACSCLYSTLKQQIGWSTNVGRLRLKAVEEPSDGPYRFKFSVEEVFKGDLKAGEIVTHEVKSNCSLFFEKEQIGSDFLMFFGDTGNEPVSFSFCSGSRAMENSSLNLLYLTKDPATQALSRVAGSLETAITDPKTGFETKPIAGANVHLTGNGQDVWLTTDTNGNYETYGLPAGKYKVEFPDVRLFETPEPREFELKENGDTEVRELYSLANNLSGRVTDGRGNGFKEVQVMLIPVGVKPRPELESDPIDSASRWYDPFESKYENTTTDDEGKFYISGISPGRYLLVVNRMSRISASSPFGAFFYPKTTKPALALPIVVKNGVPLPEIELVPPVLEPTITISGRVVDRNGSPLTPVNIDPDGESYDHTRTDADGRFVLTLLRGKHRSISASLTWIIDERVDCTATPRPGEFSDSSLLEIPKSFKIDGRVESKDFKIDGLRNRDNVVIVMPDPPCGASIWNFMDPDQ